MLLKHTIFKSRIAKRFGYNPGLKTKLQLHDRKRAFLLLEKELPNLE